MCGPCTLSPTGLPLPATPTEGRFWSRSQHKQTASSLGYNYLFSHQTAQEAMEGDDFRGNRSALGKVQDTRGPWEPLIPESAPLSPKWRMSDAAAALCPLNPGGSEGGILGTQGRRREGPDRKALTACSL